jgi:hypothetical protein
LFKNILSRFNSFPTFLITFGKQSKIIIFIMKHIATLLAVICFSVSANMLNAQDSRCSSMEYLQDQIQQDPDLPLRMQAIEQQVQQYIQNNPLEGSRAVVTIPVVVHVIYRTAAQNISDAIIQAQINQLNLDFARLNSDAGNTPSAFASVAASTNVQFCLAQRTPTGATTNGIVRKATTVTSFSTNNAVKKSSSGGSDAWPSSSYLNIWSCNLGNSLLGYAQFPGGSASTDGVVVLYSSMGSLTTPGTASPYNYGRTLTHEVGHWLNLRHIWGDDGSSCSGSDNVTDTRNQAGSNSGCPAFPRTDACSPTSPGVMFMNYMDYTYDACMNMFTQGQATRMNALFSSGGYRASLLNSLGCQPVGATCAVPSGLSTTAITNTSATFNWSAVAGATSYNAQYRAIGSSAWTSATTAANSFSASGLAAGTSYEWQVRSVCSSGSSAYSASSLFTTTSGITCGVPTGLSSSGIGNNSATLAWTAVAGASSYNLQWKLSSSATWTTVTSLTNSYSLTGLTTCSNYQFQVQANCSGTLSVNSGTASFTTTGCTVAYCASRGSNSTYEYIKQIIFGSINNTSGNNGGYGNFTALSTTVVGGQSTAITLVPGFSSTAYREYWTIYIDLNRNGSFADAGEKIATGNGTGTLTGSITVPTTALNGATRMRVQMQYGAYTTNSCTSFTYGEVEDYTINITGNPQRLADNDELIRDEETIETTSKFTLYPNPAGDKVNIEFLSRAEGNASLQVYNLMGQIVWSMDVSASEGANTETVNTSMLAAGVYIFEVKNNGEAQRQKFSISK